MTVNRRDFLKASGILGLSGNLLLPRYLAAASSPISDHKLVVLFLKGGHDSVHGFVPYNEANYYSKRPTIALAENQLLMPNVTDPKFSFGFHPALSGLKDIYDNGDMALFPAVHTGDNSSRSHFFQWDFISQGQHTSNSGLVEHGGWLNNYFKKKYNVSTGIEAFNFGSNLKALSGEFEHVKLPYPDNISLGGAGLVPAHSKNIVSLFRQNNPFSGLSRKIVETEDVLDRNQNRLKEIDYNNVSNGVAYPQSGLGTRLRKSVALFRNIPELKVTFLEQGGWDRHSRQLELQGERYRDLGDSIKAFYDDLGAERDNVTLLVMSEFGRTALENGSGGTDHGNAGAYFMIGGSQIKGRVQSPWPGYDDEDLYKGRYLQEVTDYRDLLAESLFWIDDGAKLNNQALSSSFLEYTWDQIKRYTV